MAIVSGFTYQDKDGKEGFLQIPEVTKSPKQRSISLDDIYLTRFISPWVRNPNATADTWRWWVLNEPIAMICRETLIANILALDWEIAPKKSSDRDNLRGVIRHYTDLLENGGNNPELQLDWTGLIEWLVADLLDLSFGAGAEIGRKFDNPGDRVMWIKPLDGGTLYPSLNREYPVIQMYSTYDIITFPSHAISRMYMSPRTEILKTGWGMAPPEKAYFALNMLYRSDRYYADLISDTPPAGILDLMDTEWDDALKWIESLRDFFMGAPSALKIPVLAEHTSEAKFIPFGKVPNEIMYDKITNRYAAIVASSYGLSLSDVGLEGEKTLAGSIRDERRTKRTGFARIKKKIKYWVQSFLPKELEFNFIDLDDELNVALGRARLATITALVQAVKEGIMSAAEARLIVIGDGLAGNTSLPEEPPPDAQKEMGTGAIERPGMLGRPEAASTGGQGEVRKMKSISLEKTKNFDTHLKRFVNDISNKIGSIIEESKSEYNDDEIYLLKQVIDKSLVEEDIFGMVEIIKSLWENKRWFKVSASGLADELENIAIERSEDILKWEYENSPDEYDLDESITDVKEKIHNVDWQLITEEFSKMLDEKAKVFLGKSAVYVYKELLLSENAFDTQDVEGDNNIVDKVYQSIYDNFDEFVLTSIQSETEDLINKVVEEIIK